MTLTEEVLETVESVDPLFNRDVRKPELRDGKLFINPFGVLLGKNLSGQERGHEVLNDKPFMQSAARFGILQPVIVRKIAAAEWIHEGTRPYTVVAGNRRTYALRHLVGSGTFEEGDPRGQIPIYQMNEMELEHVSPEDAANLIENGMRKGLDHISKAQAIDRLVKGGATPDELALLVTGPNRKPLGKEAIRQYRQLLKLIPSVQDAVRNGIMKVSRASTLATMSESEQLEALEVILAAQGMSKNNKNAATSDALRKLKKSKRTDDDGEAIHDDPRSAIEIRRVVAGLKKTEAWDCVPKTQKLSKEGYEAVTSIFASLDTWLQGGLTPRKYDPAQIALGLKTQILAALYLLSPK